MQSSLVIITDFLAIFKSCGTIIFPGSHVAFDGTCDVSSDATCKEALPQTGWEGLLFFYFSFCSVARWDATFGAFRGIGEGVTAFPRESWSRGGGPCIPRICEGRCPSALPLSGRSARAWPCHARHPGDFRFTTKVTKGVSGGIPLNPRGGCFAPPAASRTPSIGGSGTNPAGFATLTQ